MVTQGRLCLFGEIHDSNMICNAPGNMVDRLWLSLPEQYPTINVDIFQVMPNHFHGIIIINEVGATLVVAQSHNERFPSKRAGTRPAPTIGEIVGAFKSITTHEYIQCVRTNGWPPFNQKLWQRNYYEHILRDQTEHERIANYIESNPLNWDEDKENLKKPGVPSG